MLDCRWAVHAFWPTANLPPIGSPGGDFGNHCRWLCSCSRAEAAHVNHEAIGQGGGEVLAACVGAFTCDVSLGLSSGRL